MSIYGALVCGTFLLAFAAAVVFLYIAVSASQNLHNKMFKKLLGATTYFFDTNPAGKCRLINLSKLTKYFSSHCPANTYLKGRKSLPISYWTGTF